VSSSSASLRLCNTNKQSLHPERAEPSNSQVLQETATAYSQPFPGPGFESCSLVDEAPSVGQLSESLWHLAQNLVLARFPPAKPGRPCHDPQGRNDFVEPAGRRFKTITSFKLGESPAVSSIIASKLKSSSPSLSRGAQTSFAL
jgi:hypothetical protein